MMPEKPLGKHLDHDETLTATVMIFLVDVTVGWMAANTDSVEFQCIELFRPQYSFIYVVILVRGKENVGLKR